MDILVVDDNAITSQLFHKILTQEGHGVTLADNGIKGWELFQEKPFKLVITDWMMPGMDGIELCKKIRGEKLPYYVYVIMQSSKDDLADSSEGFAAGVDNYIVKPFEPSEVKVRINTGIRIINLEQRLLKKREDLLKEHKKLKKSYMDTVRLMSSFAEMINPLIGSYLKQVGTFSRKIASDFELDEKEVDRIEIAGLFHDVGLLGLPDLIVSKDEIHMNKTEHALFMQHPVITALIFETVPRLAKSSKIIAGHHEYMDGTGFPDGLKDSQIPLGSRIVAVVSDYFRIIHSWGGSPEEIRKRSVKNFGDEIKDAFIVDEPGPLLEEIAKKALELGCSRKYDPLVVEKMITRLALKEEHAENEKWLSIEELKPGMVLEEALCLKGGERLLSGGITLSTESVELIEKLKTLGGLAGNKVYVTENSN